jgi:hypothetical protein
LDAIELALLRQPDKINHIGVCLFIKAVSVALRFMHLKHTPIKLILHKVEPIVKPLYAKRNPTLISESRVEAGEEVTWLMIHTPNNSRLHITGY